VAAILAAATSSNMNLFYHLTAAAAATWLIECSLGSIWFV